MTQSLDSSSWHLSPRWRLVHGGKPSLVGPDKERLPLNPLQAETISGGLLRFPRAVNSDSLLSILVWAKGLLMKRVLVPAYLSSGERRRPDAEDFYIAAFTGVCRKLGVLELMPKVREEILRWSGTVLRQPLTASREYLPSRPALCLDILGGGDRSVRLALDCRDPLLTVWENISLARRLFERRLVCGRGIFDRICTRVFKDPSLFTSPYVKYLHPAIEVLPNGSRISAYWNLGSTPDRATLWDRALGTLEALGGRTDRLARFRDRFGDAAQTELLGHTFSEGRLPVLKVYAMFDGFDGHHLKETLDLEGCRTTGHPLLDAFGRIEKLGVMEGKNVGIVSLYNPLGAGRDAGIKIHFNLRDGFSRKLGMAETLAIVTGSLRRSSDCPLRLPDRLTLPNGRTTRLVAHTLSFMLSPGTGLSKITLYVNFSPGRS
jgi:hypothetical protein